MGGLTVSGTIGGKKIDGGRRRLPGGEVEVMDRQTGKWKRALSPWQLAKVKADLAKRRSLSGRLDALAGVEDPDALADLEAKGSAVVKEAVRQHRNAALVKVGSGGKG